ncbi:unnamed protein product [Didymodactylos carnosus]|uniref:Choline oxidase n=1 Tax=Didymodactylos carnosus TaxID=1234261 RepID=A0A815F6J2_9BILA|nr:unnamed protein product [Didymodactylos carnosus]CAF1321017.1 unnamed protein product [Didymodactylos carnosus]CAF3853239.1 unnamed protein product [Didymodactylos carnosus]CAF4166841.1 unnamed protein product [Didymodactylos carnosus]
MNSLLFRYQTTIVRSLSTLSNYMKSTSFDYVVCGGGTAGCIIGRRLAENPNVSVCIIEGGPSDEGNETVLDIRKWADLLGTDFDYDYGIEEQLFGNSKIRHSRAKILGGCSSHNAGIAFIAPDVDFDRWERQGAHGWNAKSTRKYYDRVFEKVNLETIAPLNPLNAAFIHSCKLVNIPELAMNSDTFVSKFSDCCGYIQLNAKGFSRYSSARAYLHPLSSLPSNLTVLTNTTVTKLIIDEQSKTVTTVLTSGGEQIKVNKECVLSGGVFDSPKLLMLSGVGREEQLKELNIPCIVNLPGVGENLLDHPESVLIWESNCSIPEPVLQRYETVLFTKTQSYSDYPDAMFHFGLEAYDTHTKSYGYPTSEQAFCCTISVTQAKSVGHVRLRSNNYRDPLKIDFQYFTDKQKHDERVMVAAFKLARQIVQQSPFEKWRKCEIAPGEHVQTDEEISHYCRQVMNTLYHPAGTCKMGDTEKDEFAVVDSQLKVKGVKNLRVADASIFPDMISVNLCITCMMIGEKCADMIKQE